MCIILLNYQQKIVYLKKLISGLIYKSNALYFICDKLIEIFFFYFCCFSPHPHRLCKVTKIMVNKSDKVRKILHLPTLICVYFACLFQGIMCTFMCKIFQEKQTYLHLGSPWSNRASREDVKNNRMLTLIYCRVSWVPQNIFHFTLQLPQFKKLHNLHHLKLRLIFFKKSNGHFSCFTFLLSLKHTALRNHNGIVFEELSS